MTLLVGTGLAGIYRSEARQEDIADIVQHPPSEECESETIHTSILIQNVCAILVPFFFNSTPFTSSTAFTMFDGQLVRITDPAFFFTQNLATSF